MAEMIPPIKALFLRLMDEFYVGRCESARPANWELSPEEVAYMEQIRTIDDLQNFTPDDDGKLQALVYDCALAMGLSKHDAMSVAGDH